MARARDAGVPSLNAARREFFAGTGDSQLTPYTSWVDFATHAKHPESVINFIAAYGTHTSITSETTLEGKRAAATAIVLGGNGAPADRLAFLNSTGAYANLANGVTTTGVDDIDFWVGGLAEQQMPFGGLLGSTFNFVFETQLEALQDGDRFYYLSRTAGLNFLTELENNSFAKLVMLNTDATHLPADVFTTPAFTLEVDPARQLTGLGVDGRADPVGDSIFVPLVERDNPATPGPDTNYLKYNGEDHVVLGGTAGNDILIASIGDDTLWGDGGNDRLEGGDGVDNINGGAGDDIITDLGGIDNIKGEDGNDVINAGNEADLILGGQRQRLRRRRRRLQRDLRRPGQRLHHRRRLVRHGVRRRGRRLDRGRRPSRPAAGRQWQPVPGQHHRRQRRHQRRRRQRRLRRRDRRRHHGCGRRHRALRRHARLRLGHLQGQSAGRRCRHVLHRPAAAGYRCHPRPLRLDRGSVGREPVRHPARR